MGLHKSKTINETEKEAVQQLMKEVDSAADLRRVQCVYLRALNFSIEQIMQATQYSANYIKIVWTLYFKNGIAALKAKPRGGRHRFNLSLDEEKELLSQYTQTGESGTMLEIAPLYKGLCEKVGRKVGLASAYRLAQRHGWRKIAPRPEHPGKNLKTTQYFKIFFPEAH